MKQVAVIGIGQSMRGDDAAGLEAVRLWQTTYPETADSPSVRVTTAELPGLALLDLLEGAGAGVIVDAVQGGATPGSLHDVSPDALLAFGEDSRSAHGWGAAEALRLGRQLNPDLEHLEIRVIGIEASQYEIGNELSPAVKEALPRASAAIQRQVERLLQATEA